MSLVPIGAAASVQSTPAVSASQTSDDATGPDQLEVSSDDGQYQGGPYFTITEDNGDQHQLWASNVEDGKVLNFRLKDELYTWDSVHRCYYHGTEIHVYEFYKNADGNRVHLQVRQCHEQSR